MIRELKRLGIETFSCFSRLVNSFTGGSADLTFSARSHVEGLWTERYIDAFFWHFFGEEDHCRVWWQIEVERSRLNIALDETLNKVYPKNTCSAQPYIY